MVLAKILMVPENPNFTANAGLFFVLLIIVFILIGGIIAILNIKRKHNRHE